MNILLLHASSDGENVGIKYDAKDNTQLTVPTPTATGLVLGEATTSLVGFYGVATPIAQPQVPKVASVVLADVVTALVNLGLISQAAS